MKAFGLRENLHHLPRSRRIHDIEDMAASTTDDLILLKLQLAQVGAYGLRGEMPLFFPADEAIAGVKPMVAPPAEIPRPGFLGRDGNRPNGGVKACGKSGF